MSEQLHQQWFTLTVAESKRLIAKGLKQYAPFAEKLHHGNIIIAKGSTNTYIYEELMAQELSSGDYINGHLLPAKTPLRLKKEQILSELVLENGQQHPISYPEVLKQMQPRDIILKGANIINYKKKQAGVLIGSPTGGTCGQICPAIEKYNLQLIIPVGLEKDSAEDIDLLAQNIKAKSRLAGNNTPWLWSIKGKIFTEIEAIKQFANVEVKLIAKGGIAGAEGGISFCVSGEREKIDIVMNLIKNIQGENCYVK